MIDDIALLGGICIGLALWVLSLKTKIARLEEYAFMSSMFMRDLADGKAEITRDSEGGITIKKKGESK